MATKSPQQTLVHETSSMLYHSAQGLPLVSLAGIWSEGGSNVTATVADDVGLPDSEIEGLNNAIHDVVRNFLERSPTLIRKRASTPS